MQDEPVIEDGPLAGDVVGGDKIIVGNISDSYTAIGAGAQVIVNQIQKALSAVDELDKSIQVAERRLAEAIQKKLAVITKPTADFVEDRGNPYKALLDYKLEDAPFFYGRSQAIAAMHEKLGNSKLTILHSDSGSGKSSLLQAGLAPRLLAAGHFPLYLRPYDQRPDQLIKKAFLSDYATQPDLARFSDETMTLRGFLERVTFYLGDRRLIIFLDQFEEFFTELTPEQQQAFAAQLRECVESDLPVWWALALRKEYFSDLRLFTALKPFENEYFLPAFRLGEAQEVIVEPAALKGVSYENGLVDLILDDIRQESDEIPPAQVQLVCYTLFEELAGDGQGSEITLAFYNEPRGRPPGMSGAEGILTSHLNRVLDRELKGKERLVAGLVLEELVTSQKRRVKRGREELLEALDLEQATLLAPVLKTLYDNRLVRRELDENDEPLYELAHDYLLNEIDLDPETQARKAAQELLNQETGAYQQHGTLLSEDKFAIINSQRQNLHLDAIARELLNKSEARFEAERTAELRQAQELAQANKTAAENARRAEEEAKRREKTTRRWLVVAVTLFLVALAAAGFALVQNGLLSDARAEVQGRANDLQARLLAEQAITEAAKNPAQRDETLALLLAIESFSREENADVHQILRTIVEERQSGRFALPGASNWAQWNVDESHLITGSSHDDNLFHGNLMVWEKGAYDEPLAILPDSAELATWNAAGDRFMTFSWSGPVSVWDVSALESREPLLTLPEDALWARWSPDGTRILTSHLDGRWAVWDGLAATPEEPLYALDAADRPIWSQDGNYLLLHLLDGTVTKLDTIMLKPVWTLPGSAVRADWAPSGTGVVVERENGRYELWDATAAPREPLATLPEKVSPVTSGWSSDGTRLLLEELNDDWLFAQNITLLDAVSGDVIQMLDSPAVWAVWEQDDTHVVTLRPSGVVDLWDGGDGRHTASIFLPASDGASDTTWYWDGKNRRKMDAIGSMIRRLNDTEYSFMSLSELPDQIANASRPIVWMGWLNDQVDSNIVTVETESGTVTIWDKSGTQPLQQYDNVLGAGDNGLKPAIESYDEGEGLLVITSQAVNLFPMAGQAWVALACETAGQNLSWKEWREAFPEEQFYHRTCKGSPVHETIIDAILLERYPADIDTYLQEWQLAAAQTDDPEIVGAIRDAIPGRISAAVLTLIQVEELTTAIHLLDYYEKSFEDQTISAETLDALCWSGIVLNRADEVLSYCQRAVQMEPDNRSYRAGRGVARAMTGETAGAAEDFRLYQGRQIGNPDQFEEITLTFSDACWACDDPEIVKMLEAGENPFDNEELAWIRDSFYDELSWE